MTDAPPPLLSVVDLCKRYGALTVSDHVGLSIVPGELHAIIGPNGAGKTSLIHQISGLVPPDSGRIFLAGRDVTQLAMAKRVQLGLTRSFQITAILPNLSVLENVALAVQARSGSSFRFFKRAASETSLNEQAAEALLAMGLEGRSAVLAARLSHGEKRQLELAIAIATAPKILLLDEPLAGTSSEESTRIVAALRSLKGRYAIILIEHDMDAVFSIADRITVLVYGRVIASGPPAVVRSDPAVRSAYLGEDEAL